MVRDDHAFAQVIQHDEAGSATESAERGLVQLGPDAGTGLERQQPDRFAAVAQRHHEQPRPSVLARLRIPDHRSGPVVDLRFLSSSGLDDSDRFRGSHSPEFANETLDRFVAAGKTVIRDQVLPDRHRVAATLQRLLNRLPVRLAGTARRWAWRGSRRLCRDRILGLRVGGHLVGRFCRSPAPTPGRPNGDSGRSQIRTGRLTTHAGGLFDPTQRPSKPPQCNNLLSLFCAQDIAHADGACFGFPSVSMSRAYLCSLAGFQVTTIGRFWVTAEAVTQIGGDARSGECSRWPESVFMIPELVFTISGIPTTRRDTSGDPHRWPPASVVNSSLEFDKMSMRCLKDIRIS